MEPCFVLLFIQRERGGEENYHIAFGNAYSHSGGQI